MWSTTVNRSRSRRLRPTTSLLQISTCIWILITLTPITYADLSINITDTINNKSKPLKRSPLELGFVSFQLTPHHSTTLSNHVHSTSVIHHVPASTKKHHHHQTSVIHPNGHGTSVSIHHGNAISNHVLTHATVVPLINASHIHQGGIDHEHKIISNVPMAHHHKPTFVHTEHVPHAAHGPHATPSTHSTHATVNLIVPVHASPPHTIVSVPHTHSHILVPVGKPLTALGLPHTPVVVADPIYLHQHPHDQIYRQHFGGYGVGTDFGGHGAGHGFYVV